MKLKQILALLLVVALLRLLFRKRSGNGWRAVIFVTTVAAVVLLCAYGYDPLAALAIVGGCGLVAGEVGARLFGTRNALPA